MTPVLWLIAAISIPGLVLLILGLRGRRVDDHPICRKCRFDLIGLPPGGLSTEGWAFSPTHSLTPPPPPPAPLCPECGADLSRPRATRTGNRVRREGLLAASTAILAICLAGAGIVTWNIAHSRNLNTLKPSWLLALDLSNAQAAKADAALLELDTRLTANSLSQSTAQSAARRLLARQSNLSIPWTPAMGDFLESLRKKDWLPDPDWTSYARNSVIPTIDTRRKVRQGDLAPTRLRITPRAGSGTTFVCEVRSTEIKLADQSVAPGPFGLNAVLVTQTPLTGKPLHDCDVIPNGGPASSVPVTSGDEPYNIPITVEPGDHTFHSAWTIKVHLNQSRAVGLNGITAEWGWQVFASSGMGQLRADGPVLAEFAPTIDLPVQVLPAEADTVTLIDDATLAQTVESALTAQLYYEKGATIFTPGSVRGSIVASNLPVDIAADVFIVEGDKERPIGPAIIRADGGSTSGNAAWLDLGLRRVPKSGLITLVLRPSPALARRTTDLTRIWGRELTLRDVKVMGTSPWAVPSTPAPAPANPP